MRAKAFRRRAAVVAVAGLVAVGAACYPPGGFPTEQPVPPGGRIVVQGLPNANMWIAGTNGDLTAIAYLQDYFTLGEQYSKNGRFWVYDDRSGTSTLLPGRVEQKEGPSGVGVSPDGRWVILASPDPALQVGPVAKNCRRSDHFFAPLVPIHCAELYRYDLETEELVQLTGLDGPSEMHHLSPRVLADGRTVEFDYSPAIPETGSMTLRLDLETGEITDAPGGICCTWVRDGYDVVWTDYGSKLTKVDHSTGEQTVVFHDPDRYWARLWSSDDGRFHVVSAGGPDTQPSYRLVDVELETVKTVKTEWFSQDGSTFALVQRNVAPNGDDRLIIAPTPA